MKLMTVIAAALVSMATPAIAQDKVSEYTVESIQAEVRFCQAASTDGLVDTDKLKPMIDELKNPMLGLRVTKTCLIYMLGIERGVDMAVEAQQR